jgi:hypothetical protein
LGVPVPESYADQLERVQTAIARIEDGAQSVTINGRTVQRAELADLYSREKWLRVQVARAENGGAIRLRQVVPRG